MKVFIVLLSLAVIATWGCAASTTSPEPAVAEVTATGEPDKKAEEEEEPDIICKMEKVTGSHIRKKRCTTRAQREAMRDDAERFIRRANTMPTVTD